MGRFVYCAKSEAMHVQALPSLSGCKHGYWSNIGNVSGINENLPRYREFFRSIYMGTCSTFLQALEVL